MYTDHQSIFFKILTEFWVKLDIYLIFFKRRIQIKFKIL